VGNRSVRAGDTIRLRILVKDDLGETAQASGVFVHLFEPGKDFLDLDEAFTVSGVPTFLGQGIFEYEFDTPDCGPDGTWIDSWEAQLACQTITGINTFDVTTSGITQPLDCQLFCNDIVQVTVTSGLQATDGTNLEDEFNLEFLTTTIPSYTNTRKVRLEVGAFVNQLPDDILQLGILEASLEADVLVFAPQRTNSGLFLHARREYVTCSASGMLLTNVGNLLLRTKTLADLHVEYDTNGVRDAMARLLDCMDKWEPQLIAGGGARAASQPRGVVKGEKDVDRPLISRSWQSTEDGHLSRRVPAANTTTDDPRTRRQKKTYVSRFSRNRTGRKYW